jgi:hypothetical protein
LPRIGTRIDSLNSFNYSNKSSISKSSSSLNSSSSNDSITIGIRLPNGSKKQQTFFMNDKMRIVLDFALNELKKEQKDINLSSSSTFALLLMPNLLIENFNRTIHEYKIQNRSMLFLIDTQLVR